MHADDVYLSTDYAALCGEVTGDARWLQACVPRVGVDDPGVIVVKEVADGAVPGVYGKFLALHTYGHVLQARIGIGDVEAASDALFGADRGVELSADCIAFGSGRCAPATRRRRTAPVPGATSLGRSSPGTSSR